MTFGFGSFKTFSIVNLHLIQLDVLYLVSHQTIQKIYFGTVRGQTMGSRTWVMFTRKRQDMRSSCLANHVTPATPVTETKDCLYISRHTPLFGALDWFRCVGWGLSPSVLEINFPSCFCITVVDLFTLAVGLEIRAQSITFGGSCGISIPPGRTTLLVEGSNLVRR